MDIVRVEITPFGIPRREPIKTVFGRLEVHDHVLVGVMLEDGTWGYGEASPLPWNGGETVASVVAVVGDYFASAVLGRDVRRSSLLALNLSNLQFVANPTARAALELALLDARSRCLDLPARYLLGGHVDSVECTAILGSGTPDHVAEDAVEFAGRLGVTSFKLKVGLQVNTDVEIVRYVREAVGPDALIYADANQAYTAAEAQTFLDETRPARLAWFEEPCPSGTDLRRNLVSRSEIPVVGDETCGDIASARRALVDGSATMLSVKPARTGVSDTLALANYAALEGTPILVGCTGESAWGTYGSAAVASASASLSANPAELLMFEDYADDIAARPEVEDGRLRLPAASGFGIDVDRDALDRLTTGAARTIFV